MPTGIDKRWWVWSVILVALAATLAFVPLFNLLAYEWCFAMALAISVAALHLGARAARAPRSPSERAFTDARPLQATLTLWAGATARAWALLLAPVAVICLNALRVRNCDLAGGFVWLAILPLASAAIASAAGVVCGLALGRGATAAAIGVFLLSVSWALWRFWDAPPINAYDPFGGYFPGTLYDEEVAVPTALLWARAYHFAGALAALALAALFLDGERGRLRLRAARRRSLLPPLALLAIAIALGASHARLGFSRSTDDVARALGAEKRTAHFVLHYSPTGPFARDIELWAADHEFRWRELSELFHVEPQAPVHAFLFDSPAQKAQLMGAGHTSIAKPWRREIYLQHEPWPHPVLKHELAHVFAGAFGDPIFHASRRGVFLDVGLVEGVATAAAWHGAPLTPHQQAHVMRARGIAPPLDAVFSLRFLRYNGSAAYAEAGSFCRFLLDTRGPAPLEAVYRAGGSAEAYRAAYGAPRAELVAEWETFVDALVVPEPQQKLAEERLGAPSVFHRVCAHELALRREAAAQAAAAGDRTRALAELESVCHDEPDDPEAIAELMLGERGSQKNDRAAATARRLLAHPKVSPPLRARAEALLADLAFEAGDLPAARARYLAAAALPLDEANARLLTVKQRIAGMDAPPPELVRMLVDPQRNAALDLATTQALATAHPDDALYQYLWARQLDQQSLWAQAAEAFARARALGLPDARFSREADRLEGLARFRLGQFDRARAAFRRLAENAPDGVRLAAEDWLRRCDFAEGLR
jgi:tetratricopeptide (TPR) repeat protein